MKPTESSSKPSTDASPLEMDFATDSQTTRGERVNRYFDQYVMTPLSILWDTWRARVGLFILSIYLLMGTVGVLVVEVPTTNQTEQYLGFLADLQYPFGADAAGQGLLGLMVHATPPMLIMIFSGAILSTIVATIVGTVSGYKGGTADKVLMTITDIMMTIPGLPLIIVLAALFEPESPALVGILLSVNVWAGLARSLRSQVLTYREESYVEASRIMGISTPQILVRDIIPNLMPFILINFVNSSRNIIFNSVGLYFLGVLPFTNLNWGVVLNKAYNSAALYSLDAVHVLLVPTFTIIMLSFGLILLSQAFDRLFNPKLRAKHANTIADEHEN